MKNWGNNNYKITRKEWMEQPKDILSVGIVAFFTPLSKLPLLILLLKPCQRRKCFTITSVSSRNFFLWNSGENLLFFRSWWKCIPYNLTFGRKCSKCEIENISWLISPQIHLWPSNFEYTFLFYLNQSGDFRNAIIICYLKLINFHQLNKPINDSTMRTNSSNNHHRLILKRRKLRVFVYKTKSFIYFWPNKAINFIK